MRIRKSKRPMRDPFAAWTRDKFLEMARLEDEKARANPRDAALHYSNAANWRASADRRFPAAE